MAEYIERYAAITALLAKLDECKHAEFLYGDEIDTILGKDIYYHQYDELNARLGIVIYEPKLPEEDDEGYTSFQLWNFMEIYSKYIGLSKPNIIKPLEIIYELPREEE